MGAVLVGPRTVSLDKKLAMKRIYHILRSVTHFVYCLVVVVVEETVLGACLPCSRQAQMDSFVCFTLLNAWLATIPYYVQASVCPIFRLHSGLLLLV